MNDGKTWALGHEFKSRHLSNETLFLNESWTSSCMSNLKNTLPVGLQKLEPRLGDASTRSIYIYPFYWGKSATRISLGRSKVNLLPVARQNNTLTNGDDGRTWALGREFESRHLSNETFFLNESWTSSCMSNLKNTLPVGRQKLEPRLGDASTRSIYSVVHPVWTWISRRSRGEECYKAYFG